MNLGVVSVKMVWWKHREVEGELVFMSINHLQETHS